MRENAGLIEEIQYGNPRDGIWSRIKEIEQEKRNILLIEEQTWRLKSRVVWLNEGDRNTKFFHAFAKGRRAYNSIWHIDEDGSNLSSTDDIKEGVVIYYNGLYKAIEPGNHEEQFWAIEEYPKMFNDRECSIFYEPINREEIKNVLNYFSKDKSPGPEGWTPDFFNHFQSLL